MSAPGPGSAPRMMTRAEAACLGLREEMRADKSVWALGEDLGALGGSGGQYLGLQAEFGRERIVDTPISESTIAGVAVGAAITGSRPIADLRYADFAICAADEIVNQAAKIRYMLGGQVSVPAVFRMPIGFAPGIAAQHSQSNEAWWVHTPGLVVVAPCTAADHRALLKAAIRCNDPVIYLEHKEMWAIAGEVDVADQSAGEIGRARIVRPGLDVTIVSWSKGVLAAEAAAQELARGGIDAEVIDLRTLWPWDRAAVLDSAARTGRLVVAHEAVQVGGFGAEIAAVAAAELWRKLKSAPVRVGGPRVPTPYAEALEQLCRLLPEHIERAARHACRA